MCQNHRCSRWRGRRDAEEASLPGPKREARKWSLETVESDISVRDDEDDAGKEEEEDDEEDELPEISLKEVSLHCGGPSSWMVIYDKVYDVTDFLHEVSF